jgi:hypothetical protein
MTSNLSKGCSKNEPPLALIFVSFILVLNFLYYFYLTNKFYIFKVYDVMI